jgi:hypothetical protein
MLGKQVNGLAMSQGFRYVGGAISRGTSFVPLRGEVWRAFQPACTPLLGVQLTVLPGIPLPPVEVRIAPPTPTPMHDPR